MLFIESGTSVVSIGLDNELCIVFISLARAVLVAVFIVAGVSVGLSKILEDRGVFFVLGEDMLLQHVTRGVAVGAGGRHVDDNGVKVGSFFESLARAVLTHSLQQV